MQQPKMCKGGLTLRCSVNFETLRPLDYWFGRAEANVGKRAFAAGRATDDFRVTKCTSDLA